MRRRPFFCAAHMHRDLQHHRHAVKAVKTAPLTRPFKESCIYKSYKVTQDVEVPGQESEEDRSGPPSTVFFLCFFFSLVHDDTFFFCSAD